MRSRKSKWTRRSCGDFVDCKYFGLAADQLAEPWHYMIEWSLASPPPLRWPLAGTLRLPSLITRGRQNGAKREAIATWGEGEGGGEKKKTTTRAEKGEMFM